MFTQTHVAITGLCSSHEEVRGDILRIVNEHRRAQPPSSQVGGGARVPSTSQDGRTVIPVSRACTPEDVRQLSHYGPEDVSQSSHYAVEVRSAQSDRTPVWVSGDEDNSSQSRGNASVDAGSVVGPRYEAVRQCSQYELSGPGMPRMITGGMPSGVPPSVCPSADAMCQQYVDSHMMKSQLATTTSKQYSPDLFTPVAVPST